MCGRCRSRRLLLSETAEVAARSLANTRTMGVGLSPTIIPEAGRPTFELAEGEMELGIGIHGEPGIRREEMRDANRIADVLLDGVLAELELTASSRVAVLVNSLGATPEEELYIVYGRVADRLAADGVARSSRPCRQVRDKPRDGGLLALGDGARRRAHLAPRCPSYSPLLRLYMIVLPQHCPREDAQVPHRPRRGVS